MLGLGWLGNRNIPVGFPGFVDADSSGNLLQSLLRLLLSRLQGLEAHVMTGEEVAQYEL